MGLADFWIVIYWEKRLLSYSIVSDTLPRPFFPFWLNKKECKTERRKTLISSFFSFPNSFQKIEELLQHPSRKKLQLSNDFSRKRELNILCILLELHSVSTYNTLYDISKYKIYLIRSFFQILIQNQNLQKDHGMNV